MSIGLSVSLSVCPSVCLSVSKSVSWCLHLYLLISLTHRIFVPYDMTRKMVLPQARNFFASASFIVTFRLQSFIRTFFSVFGQRPNPVEQRGKLSVRMSIRTYVLMHVCTSVVRPYNHTSVPPPYPQGFVSFGAYSDPNK